VTAAADLDSSLAGDGTAAGRNRPRALVVALVALIAVAVAGGALAVGWKLGQHGRVTAPSSSSVDAGFSRDMSVHHQQAVTMAIYERAHTTDPDLALLAYDIEDTQTFEMGQMQGWLDTWRLSPTSSQARMAWMAGHAHLTADGLMPGMATATQLSELKSASGRALDILFLQLMIHHHQGGIPMAQYAAAHATEPYVRKLANAMVTFQSDEIVQMEQVLRQLGGAPLPAPAAH
jgi:uncharacterized protein (DUF305 family)